MLYLFPFSFHLLILFFFLAFTMQIPPSSFSCAPGSLASIFSGIMQDIQKSKAEGTGLSYPSAPDIFFLSNTSLSSGLNVIINEDIHENEADYIPAEASGSSGEDNDIICISSDSEEEEEEEKQHDREPQVIFIISDEEEEIETYTALSAKRKRNARLIQTKQGGGSQHKRSREDERSTGYKCTLCKTEVLKHSKSKPLKRMAKIKKDVYCEGCARLVTLTDSEMERRDMIAWFITGKLPRYDMPPNLTSLEVYTRLVNRRSYMRNRFLDKVKNGSPRIDVHDLTDIYISSEQKCVISGHHCYLHNKRINRVPYWALTYDHIVPLKQWAHNPKAWSKSNLQIMCYALNKVKGHCSDAELKRWYRELLNSQIIIL
ncbi:uncharacterized protein B0P05DRAFT_567022, partial [Gilbertella persicaria]|uniref:uncharacterized protein n=1 Tax=Gilbertella persicaria TaxID=101096 RepID=UPI00222059D1